MKRILFIAALALLLPVSANAEEFVPAPGEFEAAIIMQPKSRNVIYAYNPEKPHVPASLTKLLTGLATIETHPTWERVVSIEAEDEVGGGRLRVATGATLSIRDLFYSALSASANNAAMALSRVSGMSREVFVAKMNDVAKRVGAKNTVVHEASGMEVANITTAYDMARIAEAAFDNDVMRRAATVGSYRFSIRNTGEVKTITSTNAPFLYDNDVWLIGGKTGYLNESKYNLVSRLEPYKAGAHDPKYQVIVVVLGAPTKQGSFDSVKRLAEWAWSHPEKFVEPIEPENMLKNQLVYGMRNNEVVTLQKWLSLDKEVYPEAVTSGFFGPLTLQAVQRFQVKYGVVGGAAERGYGIVGPATRAKLYEFYLAHHLDIKADEAEAAARAKQTAVNASGIGNILAYGQRSEEVRLLQSWLAKERDIYPEAIVSGFFGQLTLQAVQRFQLKYGVVRSASDTGFGIVGPSTRAKLHDLYIEA